VASYEIKIFKNRFGIFFSKDENWGEFLLPRLKSFKNFPAKKNLFNSLLIDERRKFFATKKFLRSSFEKNE